MCGIVGTLWLDGAGRPDPGLIIRMRDLLRHRGPDEEGMNLAGPIGLGFRRLSVIDIPGGSQPMIDPATGVSLVLNGEIYNYRALRADLEGRGHRFRTQSDTEVLLRSFIEWGADALPRLVGMFAFAVWDPRDRTLVLARDRLGIKPLYWTMVGSELLFASEVKAFLRHPGFVPEPDLDGISSYLSFRQAVWDLTFYRGVQRVLPGHMLVVRDGAISTSVFWRLPVPRPDDSIDEDAYVARIEELLGTAIDRCLVADVPIGAYLSGGLDSSLMVAMMAARHRTRIHTFSIGYGQDGYDEGQWAERVARHVGADHHHLVMRSDGFRELWVAAVRQRDAPISIPHEIALLDLSREVKRHVSVALSGDGADELFGGYGRVQRSPMDWHKVRAARTLLGRRVAGRIARLPGVRGSPFEWIGCGDQLDQFFRVYHWIPFAEKWDLFTPDVRARLDGDGRTIGVFRDAFDEVAEADPYDRVLHVFQKIHLGCLLDKLDAMGMAASVEGRVPFVDHELVEFVTNMPFTYKLRWNSRIQQLRAATMTAASASERLDTTKHALRRVADGVLPPDIVGRRKLGFPTPLDAWLGDGLMTFAREVLLDRRARERGIFDPKAIERFLARSQDLPYDFFGKKVWMLTNVELWLREVVDDDARAAA